MRDDIRELIERKVEERVHHEMEYLRAEAHASLEFQRRGTVPHFKGGKHWAGHWPHDNYFGHGYNHYQGGYYNPYYYNGFGYYGQPYGQTGYVPKNEEDEYLYNI